MRMNDMYRPRHHGRYFWWGSVRLDSDPWNERQVSELCATGSEEGCSFDPEYIWVTPGWIEIALTLSAFPALILAVSMAHGLARLGISELLSFMLAMPLSTLAWFYGVGWLLDRWRFKRSLRRTSIVPV